MDGALRAVATGEAIAGQAKTKHRGLDKVRWQFSLALAGYNLMRIPKLLEAEP